LANAKDEKSILGFANQLFLHCKDFKAEKICFSSLSEDLLTEKFVSILVHGLELSNYHFTVATLKPQFHLKEVVFPSSCKAIFESELFKYYHLAGRCKNIARDLGNGRTNHVDIDYFIEAAKKLGQE